MKNNVSYISTWEWEPAKDTNSPVFYVCVRRLVRESPEVPPEDVELFSSLSQHVAETFVIDGHIVLHLGVRWG